VRGERLSREGDARVFWKMVYGKIFRKPFSLFYTAIFRSIYVDFLLTSVLQRPKRPKMLKTFYRKRFTSKQTETNWFHLWKSLFKSSSSQLSNYLLKKKKHVSCIVV
jgi:hypothetical protein